MTADTSLQIETVLRRLPGRQVGLSSGPEHIKQVADASLKRLKVDTIDLFYQHPVNPDGPDSASKIDVPGARYPERLERMTGL